MTNESNHATYHEEKSAETSDTLLYKCFMTHFFHLVFYTLENIHTWHHTSARHPFSQVWAADPLEVAVWGWRFGWPRRRQAAIMTGSNGQKQFKYAESAFQRQIGVVVRFIHATVMYLTGIWVLCEAVVTLYKTMIFS